MCSQQFLTHFYFLTHIFGGCRLQRVYIYIYIYIYMYAKAYLWICIQKNTHRSFKQFELHLARCGKFIASYFTLRVGCVLWFVVCCVVCCGVGCGMLWCVALCDVCCVVVCLCCVVVCCIVLCCVVSCGVGCGVVCCVCRAVYVVLCRVTLCYR